MAGCRRKTLGSFSAAQQQQNAAFARYGWSCKDGRMHADTGAGRYIKIAEKGRYRPKSSIVVPVSGLAEFLQVLKYMYAEACASRWGSHGLPVFRHSFQRSLPRGAHAHLSKLLVRSYSHSLRRAFACLRADWDNHATS